MKEIRKRLTEKAARNKIPIISSFELLPVCNLKCKMCYVRKDMAEVAAAGGLKDAKFWLGLAEEARNEGLLYPLLTGGEPFLHPEFAQIMGGMQKMGLQVSINSNATMIDREWAAWLGKHKPVRINVTLYGASEESYERLCGNGAAFQKVIEGVRLLKEYDVPVKFNASITPENVHELEDIIRCAKSFDSPIQVATYMFPPIRRDNTLIGQNERLSPEEAGHARVLADLLQNEPNWFCGQAARFSRFVPLEQLKDLRVDPEMKIGMRCRAGLCSFWVDWQGRMTNCGMFGSVYSSLEGRSFKAAWDELAEKTAQIRYAPACAQCPNLPLCRPCIAMVYNECGDLSGKPEYMCRMNEAAAKYYGEYMRKHYPDRVGQWEVEVSQDDICEL